MSQAALDALAPPRTIRVCVAGQDLDIAPAPVSALAAMLRDGGDVFAALGTLPLLALFAQHSDGLIAIAAHGSGRRPDWIGTLQGDEFFDLLGAVIEVNSDFFAHRLLPAMNKLMEAAARGISVTPLPTPSTH